MFATIPSSRRCAYLARSLTEALELLGSCDTGLDLLEMRGDPGAGRSQLAFRRQFRSGRTFDIVTECDLSDPEIQQLL